MMLAHEFDKFESCLHCELSIRQLNSQPGARGTAALRQVSQVSLLSDCPHFHLDSQKSWPIKPDAHVTFPLVTLLGIGELCKTVSAIRSVDKMHP